MIIENENIETSGQNATNSDSEQRIYPLKRTIEDPRDWPIYRLSEDREKFHAEIRSDVISYFEAEFDGPSARYDLLADALYQERIRVNTNPWKADPPDEKDYWNGVRSSLLQIDPRISGSEQRLNKIVSRIVDRYADEIIGRFDPAAHRLAKTIVTFLFSRLLNAAPGHRLRGLWSSKRTIHDKMHITGDIELIRRLSDMGTLVFVPTHSSNLDSLALGSVIESLGLPALIYGAGLNLYDIQLFSHFMNRLGAYKVDRRKKNAIYLETLKSHSVHALMRGAHSLFYPGGTRSRSGMLEDRLKLGLLGTTVEAQRRMLSNKPDSPSKKIFIVPIILSYHSVLEAPALIEQYLRSQGRERYLVEQDRFSTSYKMAKFIAKFLSSGTEFAVSFGAPSDVFGNQINSNGESLGISGDALDLKDYFLSKGKITADEQRNAEYTRQLGKHIVKSYYKHNVVLSSHLVAHAAFKLIRENHPGLDLYETMRIPHEDTRLPYVDFAARVDKIKAQLFKRSDDGQVILSRELREGTNSVVAHGLKNMGMYHAMPSLKRDIDGAIISNNIPVLFFYHNRLNGYNLD